MEHRTVLVWLLWLGAVLGTTPSPYHREPKHAAAPHPDQYRLRPDFKITSKTITRKYELIITNTTAAPDGFLRSVLAINGQTPGPLIEVSTYNHDH